MKTTRSNPLVFTDLSADDPSGLFEPVPGAEVDLSSQQRSTTAPARNELGFARHAYALAGLAAVVWAAGLFAFVAGFQTQFGAFAYTPLQWGVIGMLAAMPATFMLLTASALRLGARLAAETRRARAMADDLAIPAALAVDHTTGALEAMRREIGFAAEAARDARAPIVTLRETLTVESRKLSEAAAEAQATGRMLAELLGNERGALAELNQTMKTQAADAAEALARQAQVVAEASDLAQAQLNEAQAALAARAADLAVAAGDARHAAEMAGDVLTGQIERLENAGATAGEQANALADGLGREREQLAGLAETLRADQEDLTAKLEAQRAQLSDAVAGAREGATALSAASGEGADALRSLIATAAEEVRRLAETAQREQSEIEAGAKGALGLFSGAVAEERAAIEAQTRAAIDGLAAAAEEARQAAAGHIEAAADAARAHTDAARSGLESLAGDVANRIDNLGEAAFAAGRQADQAFETRIATARRLIEQSTEIVEDSSERSARRIEAGAAAARAAAAELDSLLVEVDERMERLPEESRARADAIRDSIAQGLGDLTTAARRAAEETQAIDAAFQERVRRNYEVLSEAVRMMGRVAGSSELPRPPEMASGVGPAIKPAAPVIRPAAQAEPVAMPELRAAVSGDRGLRVSLSDGPTALLAGAQAEVVRPAALSDPYAAETVRRGEPGSAAAAGLRPRLKLSSGSQLAPRPEPKSEPKSEARPAQPIAAEPEAPVAASANAKPEPAIEAGDAADGWTWKDLLASMDEPTGDDDALAERLIAEIEALGVDPAALLPRPRIDEIAAALQTGDAGGAREVVRRLAPAAVRRLSRRVLTDKSLRLEVDRYVRRYEGLLSDSAQRDREGYMTAALLGSEPGRAFLLLDAAVGDLH